jgi:hypothetical protein
VFNCMISPRPDSLRGCVKKPLGSCMAACLLYAHVAIWSHAAGSISVVYDPFDLISSPMCSSSVILQFYLFSSWFGCLWAELWSSAQVYILCAIWGCAYMCDARSLQRLSQMAYNLLSKGSLCWRSFWGTVVWVFMVDPLSWRLHKIGVPSSYMAKYCFWSILKTCRHFFNLIADSESGLNSAYLSYRHVKGWVAAKWLCYQPVDFLVLTVGFYPGVCLALIYRTQHARVCRQNDVIVLALRILVS